MRCLAGEFAGGLDDLGHAGHAADEDEFVDVGGGDAGFLETIPDRLLGALEKAVGELLQLGAGEGELDVLRSGGSAVMKGRLMS